VEERRFSAALEQENDSGFSPGNGLPANEKPAAKRGGLFF